MRILLVTEKNDLLISRLYLTRHSRFDIFQVGFQLINTLIAHQNGMLVLLNALLVTVQCQRLLAQIEPLQLGLDGVQLALFIIQLTL